MQENGLILQQDMAIAVSKAPKIDKFSLESRYVLELALNAARLKQKKYIDTEHILLALIQLTQLGDENLADIFQKYEVNVRSLSEKVAELQ